MTPLPKTATRVPNTTPSALIEIERASRLLEDGLVTTDEYDKLKRRILGSQLDTSMRARQLASTVHQGRKIRIQLFDEDPFTCYLCGWDQDTYFVVIPPGDGTNTDPVKRLVSKASILYIDLFDEKSFFDEPSIDDMRSLVVPFRTRIDNDYFPNSRKD